RTHEDCPVPARDRPPYAGRLENLASLAEHPRHRFVQGDIADPAVASPLVREADVVVNFAAETHVDRSIRHAADFITTDVYGTFVLLEPARANPALRRFVPI